MLITKVLFFVLLWMLQRRSPERATASCLSSPKWLSGHLSLAYCLIFTLVTLYGCNGMASCPIICLALNDVKQGGVFSPILFCLYIDGLFVALSKAGVGCFIVENLEEAFVYADDLVLLSPSPSSSIYIYY